RVLRGRRERRRRDVRRPHRSGRGRLDPSRRGHLPGKLRADERGQGGIDLRRTAHPLLRSALATRAMMAAMVPPRPVVFLLACAAIVACSGSNRNDIPASQSYFTENPSHPIVGDVPPADMDTILEAHNHKRKLHCAPPLEWSAELAEGAQAWADKLAKRGCA